LYAGCCCCRRLWAWFGIYGEIKSATIKFGGLGICLTNIQFIALQRCRWTWVEGGADRRAGFFFYIPELKTAKRMTARPDP